MNNQKSMLAKQFTPNEDRRARIKILAEFLSGKQNGSILSWLEIETESGLIMNEENKNLFRHCCHKANREYIALPGNGIELQSAGNALEIANRAGHRIVNAVQLAVKTTANLAPLLPEMSEEHKAKFLTQQATFATLDLSKSLAKPRR